METRSRSGMAACPMRLFPPPEQKAPGVHTELMSDGIVQLMKDGVVDNSMKPVNRGKAVASFCMGKKEPTSSSTTTEH